MNKGGGGGETGRSLVADQDVCFLQKTPDAVTQAHWQL